MKRCGLLAVVALSFFGFGCVVLPEAQLPDTAERQLVGLDQGWDAEDRELYYHQSQGTVMVPYDWFMALEQPEIKFIGEVDMFADQEYLARYGFLPSRPFASDASPTEFGPAQADCDPDHDKDSLDYTCGLPVGLSRADVVIPDTGKTENVVGFTCAACHTGELHFQDVAIRIEGATNLVDVTQFQSALGGAMLLTQRFPFRFNRFAERVLASRGLDPDDDDYAGARDELRTEVADFMDAGSKELKNALSKGLYADYPGGFGRTDALARIGNMVFGTEMENEDNLAVGSAPVKFPTIWDAPYFSWAQYNGSIEQSMVRNVGEALGTRAKIAYKRSNDLWADEAQFYVDSTVDIPGLYAIETLLRGEGNGYFNGLQSPIWPQQYLGAIDWQRADAGQKLYADRCQKCHLAPLTDLLEVGPMPGGAPDELAVVPKGTDVVRNGIVVGRDPEAPAARLNYGPEAPSTPPWISNNDPSMTAGLLNPPGRTFDQTEFFLEFGTVNLGTIRTDPGQARNFASAVIDTKQFLLPKFPDAYIGPSPFPQRIMGPGVGLQMVTINIMDRFFNTVDNQSEEERREFIANLPSNLLTTNDDGTVVPRPGLFANADGTGDINRDEWNGYRAPAADPNLGYRPRTLNGMWAAPPYLHNGSVPNIYALLSPYEERPKVFYTGTREYDPRHLGYETGRFKGGFRFDTSKEGNSNYGHLFQAGTMGDGIIGSELTPDDRLAIIEFLKTLCPGGFEPNPASRTDPTQSLCTPLLPQGNR